MILNNLASILLYVTVFLVSAVLMYLSYRTKKRVFILLALIPPIVLASIRFMVGTDFQAYDSFYTIIQNENSEVTISRLLGFEMEPFIIMTSLIGGIFHLGSWFMFFVYAAITVLFAYLTFRLVDRKNSWILYGSFLFITFLSSFNQMRQAAAIAVLAFLIMYIISNINAHKRTRLLYIFLGSIFAVSLHYSSVILLPILLIPFISTKIKRTVLYPLLTVGIAASALLLPTILNFVVGIGVLPEKQLSTLLSDDYGGSILNFSFYVFFVLFIIMANHYRSQPKNKKGTIYTTLMGIGALYASFGFHSGYLGRLADLFWVFAIIAIWEIINDFQDSIYKKALIMFLFCFAYFTLVYVVLGVDAIIPYQTLGAGNV